jgi:hypothetical protein
MDRPATYRGLRLVARAEVYHPRPRPRPRLRLRRVFQTAASHMGIRDRPTAPRSPWQNGHAERLIGSIRRECLDHVVVFGERHLRHILLSYMTYYNGARTHLSLNKNAPIPRRVQAVGRISADANSRRTSPSVCSDLISDRDTTKRFCSCNRLWRNKSEGLSRFS